MSTDKALIKNAVLEDMFLKVAPDPMIQTYFDYFESDDPMVAEKKMALGTMMASKYSKIAFDELLDFYKKTTGKHFQLYTYEQDGIVINDRSGIS